MIRAAGFNGIAAILWGGGMKMMPAKLSVGVPLPAMPPQCVNSANPVILFAARASAKRSYIGPMIHGCCKRLSTPTIQRSDHGHAIDKGMHRNTHRQ